MADGPTATHEAGEGRGADPTPPARAHERVDEDRTSGPRVHVHRERLERRVAPMELSPTEALRLAEEGRAGLSRRELPPDVASDDPGGSSDTDEG